MSFIANLFLVPFVLTKINDILLYPSFQHVFWNSQVGGISHELPNLTNRYAAFLSRTERTTKLSDTVRRLL